MKLLRELDGVLRVRSDLFSLRSLKNCRFSRFIETTFSFSEVESLKVDTYLRTAQICYDPARLDGKTLFNAISLKSNYRKNGVFISRFYRFSLNEGNIESLKLTRYENLVTNWEMVMDIPGRLRVKQPLLRRKKKYCQRIEKSLFNTVGVEKYKVSSLTTTATVTYDETKVTRNQLIKAMEKALEGAFGRHKRDGHQLDFFLSTSSMGLAAVGNYVFPPLLPLNIGLVFYTARYSFKDAAESLKKKELNVDILDTIITVACLVTGHIFAAALMTWCLSIGRTILDKTSNDSKKLLTQIYGKQARFTWLVKDNQEIEFPVERLKKDDVIAISTGEYIPVDGEVVRGDGMVDQHILTGECAPVEKKVGDETLAATVLLAGKLYIKVKETGEKTTASKIKQIISQSAQYKVRVQSSGEKMANRLVVPTLGLATAGYFTGGQSAALAIINCDYGTGLRIAAPMGLLSSLANAARNGILVKNGAALETLSQVDTFLFDKTGTLTKEMPEVRKVISTSKSLNEEIVLAHVAAAEKRFTHPIAKAILKKAEEEGIKLPRRDESKYHVGYGIEVGINGHIVRVGSSRFMERESINIPGTIQREMKSIRHQGNSLILLAIDNSLAGAIELGASHRPEAYGVIQGLKKRGIKNLVLISGDHEAPTRSLAQSLGIGQYYAEVLPRDKAEYVKMLKKNGSKVAMVGDGINDSPALSRADVSISLRGASDIATDVADIVFMDDGLSKINLLYDISCNLERNVARSFKLIVIPNTICIVAALLGRFGLGASMILNNGFNFIATLNGILPLQEIIYEEDKMSV